jgi:outer membrane lipoprotein-sorting protein
MFKLLLGTSVFSVLIGLIGVSQAQISPGVTPPKSTIPTQTQPIRIPSATPPNSTTPVPERVPKAPGTNTTDLNLLSKAVGVFWQSDRTETESQMLIKGEQQGVKIETSAQVKTIAQIGNKFQTQLLITPAGSTPKAAYTIVSNGRDVWIYRPDRRQYAKTTFDTFRSGSNWLWTGVSSSLFLTISAADRQEILSALGTERDVIKSIPPSQFKDLIGSERQVDGQNLYSYSYNFKGEGFVFDVLVQPQAATVQRIELNGKVDGMNISLSEKILSRKPQAVISKQTFQFVPPQGVKKVKAIEIELFKS